jgi:AraC-like DNA-binding protein
MTDPSSLFASRADEATRQLQRAITGVVAALPAEFDTAAIVRRAGLSEPVAALPVDAYTEAAFHGLWRAIMATTDDPTLPFEIGTRLPLGTYGIVDFLAGTSATVGLGFSYLERYFGLISPSFEWRCEPSRSASVVELVAREVDPELALVFHQFIVGVTLARFQLIAAAPLVFRSVGLAMPEPPDRSRHAAFFRCRVRYGTATTRIELAAESWRTPMNRSEPELRQVLEPYADLLLALPPPGDPLSPVRRAIRDQLAGRIPSLDVVSRALAVSVRTLQRRLHVAGTTFHAVVDEERAVAAKTYLRDPAHSQRDVADLLGYAECSAFTRAFRRWTGMTPSRFRACLSAARR